MKPYFALRSYQDGGEHFEGQIGSEPTPQDFLEALWTVTAECKRVLKPSGSIFWNLGDKYAGSGGHNNAGVMPATHVRKECEQCGRSSTSKRCNFCGGRMRWTEEGRAATATRRSAPDSYNKSASFGDSNVRAKSLMLLPERYRIGAVDRLGLIARAVIVWSKPNGLPESVTDRVRRSHEDWVHLTKEPRYFSAVDEVREPHLSPLHSPGQSTITADRNDGDRNDRVFGHPLGKLPGSVWTIATEPLKVPESLGVDHFAAFPQEWPRRLILGWSPSGICVECGEGRRPVVHTPTTGTDNNPDARKAIRVNGGMGGTAWRKMKEKAGGDRLTGYACACPEPTAPTRPAVVLDPFCGTGTTVMVASALGRHGIGVDLSRDYLRLAEWRIGKSGHASKSIRRTWNEHHQEVSLFEVMS